MTSYHQSAIEKIFCDCDASGLKLERNTGHTASCNRKRRSIAEATQKQAQKKASQKEVNKVSDKMGFALKVYAVESRLFIKGKKCVVFPEKDATEVHHQKGRATIELLLDKDFWLPVSRDGHIKIEMNPEWAKEQGFSFSRLAKETA